MPTYRVPVEITYSASGGPASNVWHVRTTLGWGADPLQLQAAVDAIHTFYNSVADIGSTNGIYQFGTSLQLGQVVDVSSQETASPSWTKIDVAAGNQTSPTLLAIVVTWRTSIAARRGRGRTFLGPLNALALDAANGTPNDSLLTKVRNAAGTLVSSSSTGNGWGIGVYGQQDMMSGPGVTPEMRAAAPHVLRDITGYTVRDKFGVLRSRRD